MSADILDFNCVTLLDPKAVSTHPWTVEELRLPKAVKLDKSEVSIIWVPAIVHRCGRPSESLLQSSVPFSLQCTL